MSEHSDLKKEFQIERMILFTDAVFAIAITLLVIEIKAPEIHENMTLSEMAKQLLSLMPKFIGFIISFFVIAIYWRSHHRLFSFIKDYDDKLIWLNFFFLFSIILMPFSSAYYSDNTMFSLPFWFYSANITLTGFFNYLMLTYIIRHKGRISDGFDDLKARQLARWRTLIVPSIFLLGIIIDACLPSRGHMNMLSRFTPMLIWPAIALLNRFFGKVHDLEYHAKVKARYRK
ncbi:TMEM175 family protein [Pedobacter punctiformis]|uniref:TMEM175 family protein n=1 Tax=Pedobacter punctiformis TaxID=3004097 RepID=A0ABT4L4A1_9SPHI|nr:TMEM175 family protein [Pedobacter sp. HCMS5-2]MCZ4242537.1 TMEM175 family protein [Pedobacter sp. HCMS5-2]